MGDMEKLNISFWIWAMFDDGEGVYHDLNKAMRELKERGFNCIRMESGAGLLRAPDGTMRGEVRLHRPFGSFNGGVRQFDAVGKDCVIDLPKRLAEVFRAAAENDVKIILSSWYYLHTNWFLDEEINKPLFDMPTKDKFEYFTDELDGILSIIRENGRIGQVVFAEIQNEIDGMYFCGDYNKDLPVEEAEEIRAIHEACIERLKAHHPDVLFAYDTFTCYTDEHMVPRNIDVLNFHAYRMWSMYGALDRGMLRDTYEEMDIPADVRRYLIDPPFTVADVMRARGSLLRTGIGWGRRAAFYSSLCPERFAEMEKIMEDTLRCGVDDLIRSIRNDIASIKGIRDRCAPKAELVMGEGISYCCSNRFLWEEHSDAYWDMIARHIDVLREFGVRGSVVRTTSGPEDPSWEMRKNSYIALNRRFREG